MKSGKKVMYIISTELPSRNNELNGSFTKADYQQKVRLKDNAAQIEDTKQTVDHRNNRGGE
uniref:Uncharacterized protein n=1 Tax=Arion vulgaris TaxID=1028688 RepID=A0A0B7BMP7_9EUPU